MGEGAVSEEKGEGPDPEGQTVEKEGPPGEWEGLPKKQEKNQAVWGHRTQENVARRESD